MKLSMITPNLKKARREPKKKRKSEKGKRVEKAEIATTLKSMKRENDNPRQKKKRVAPKQD
jgi:hypothetical protein